MILKDLRKQLTLKVIYLLPIVLLVSCGTTIKELDEGDEIYLSGDWNDTDSQLVSKVMVTDVLSRPWLADFNKINKHKPAVIVGRIRNQTQEHINTRTFISDIERALINSGLVKFVASKGERIEIREERLDMELNASAATRKPMGMELGADFILQGIINSISDSVKGKEVRFYQVDLTLISLSDNSKVWLGQKKIKRLISGS